MKTERDQNASNSLIENLFNGSIALIGICLTIVALFHVTDKTAALRVDECFSFSSALYLLTMVFAYVYLRKPHLIRFRYAADITFTLALLSTILSIGFLIYELHYYA